uniref:Uncharacterized protein n=1 Tax=Schizaphis graminum TaxID=13262 RepID=A0A2S2NGZ4_SCHGA
MVTTNDTEKVYTILHRQHGLSLVWCLAATTTDRVLALCASYEPWRYTADVHRSYPVPDRPSVVYGPRAPGEPLNRLLGREVARIPLTRACTFPSSPWSGRNLSSCFPRLVTGNLRLYSHTGSLGGR